MDIRLTRGAISAILSGETPKHPVLQCLYTTPIGGIGGSRTGVVVSDGVHQTIALLVPQLHKHVRNGKFANYTIFRLNRYEKRVIKQTEKVIVCYEIDILENIRNGDVGDIIGTPVPMDMEDKVKFRDTRLRVKDSFCGKREPKPQIPAKKVERPVEHRTVASLHEYFMEKYE